MTFIELHLKQGDGTDPILVNPDQIGAITGDQAGARVHMAVTGHSWGVVESPHQILNLTCGTDCDLPGFMPEASHQPPPPPPRDPGRVEP